MKFERLHFRDRFLLPVQGCPEIGKEDITVLMLQNIFRREMRNLAEGRPVKQWIRPERLGVGQAHA